MQEVGIFEKVSLDQFTEALSALFAEQEMEAPSAELVEVMYDGIKLPERATKGSAGYDFKAPVSFHLDPNDTIKIPTGIRAKINDGWCLICMPRSSLGFKYSLQLVNTVGLIDSDYQFADNEGHIFAKMTNYGNKPIDIFAGQSFLQGVFLPFGVTEDDSADGVRTGGMGSTDKK